MVVNFYLNSFELPDDVREYDHVDMYFDKDHIQMEFSYAGDIVPSRVIRVFDFDSHLKGVSFDG